MSGSANLQDDKNKIIYKDRSLNLEATFRRKRGK